MTGECVTASGIFEGVMSLGVFMPMRGPASFDAGSFLQQSIILSKFRVTLSGQPTEQKAAEGNGNVKSYIY